MRRHRNPRQETDVDRTTPMIRTHIYIFSVRHPQHAVGGMREYLSRKKADEAHRCLKDGGYFVGPIVKVPR